MRHHTSTASPCLEASERRSRRLSEIYRDIGLFAVAVELDLIAEDLGDELENAIERGAGYLAPRPLALAS